jgi:hypothetical protein
VAVNCARVVIGPMVGARRSRHKPPMRLCGLRTVAASAASAGSSEPLARQGALLVIRAGLAVPRLVLGAARTSAAGASAAGAATAATGRRVAVGLPVLRRSVLPVTATPAIAESDGRVAEAHGTARAALAAATATRR